MFQHAQVVDLMLIDQLDRVLSNQMRQRCIRVPKKICSFTVLLNVFRVTRTNKTVTEEQTVKPSCQPAKITRLIVQSTRFGEASAATAEPWRKIKNDIYSWFLLISSKASLPSLRVLITNQESNIPMKQVKSTNEASILIFNLF